MRPPVQRQSALRAPLNDIFGTEGGVRLLRALTMAYGPMSVGILAQRTRLDRSSARRALSALLDTGLLDVLGEGRARHYALRRAHPLVPAITALFQAEHQRAEAVFEGIRKAVREVTPPPMAVWLEGAVATESDEPGESLIIRVIESAKGLRGTLDQLRQAVGPLEQALDVTIAVTGATPADLASQRESNRALETRLHGARSIAGLPPVAFLPHARGAASSKVEERQIARHARTHADLDEQGLVIAGVIARRLRQDPTLVTRALEFVERRLQDASPHERHELDEWAQLLRTASPARLRLLLVDRGERSTRLRQTLPFLGVLTAEERQALLANAAVEPETGDEA